MQTIRSLGLNIKPRLRRKRKKLPLKQDGIVRNILVSVKRVNHHDPNTILATCNIQSIRRKELQLSELITDHAVDILVITNLA